MKLHGSVNMKMMSPVSLTILGLMVFFCKADALPTKDGEPRRCYQCSGQDCGVRPSDSATCPAERPYCATVAVAPNYASSLTCAADSRSPCSLTHSEIQTLELICICTGHLCNAPFSKDLQYELIAFSSTKLPNNTTDYIDTFWRQSHLVIDNDSHIYQKITMKVLAAIETPIHNVSEMPKESWSEAHALLDLDEPRGEMLMQKQETTPPPSDDDEDESEGSGVGVGAEDGPAARRTTAADLAAHTALLPTSDEDDSSAIRPFLTLIAALPAFFYLLL